MLPADAGSVARHPWPLPPPRNFGLGYTLGGRASSVRGRSELACSCLSPVSCFATQSEPQWHGQELNLCFLLTLGVSYASC